MRLEWSFRKVNPVNNLWIAEKLGCARTIVAPQRTILAEELD
jgi:hypothetical protein